MARELHGTNYIPQDLEAKFTGRARYAEDFRADGMLFAKLLLSPMPHARVRSIDTSAALGGEVATVLDVLVDAVDMVMHQRVAPQCLMVGMALV